MYILYHIHTQHTQRGPFQAFFTPRSLFVLFYFLLLVSQANAENDLHTITLSQKARERKGDVGWKTKPPEGKFRYKLIYTMD